MKIRNIIAIILLIPPTISFAITGLSILSFMLLSIPIIVYLSQFKQKKTQPVEVKER